MSFLNILKSSKILILFFGLLFTFRNLSEKSENQKKGSKDSVLEVSGVIIEYTCMYAESEQQKQTKNNK